ncbi:MAG: UvrD-helicase domain-containing protein [Gemmatimonadota bacterium]
MADGRGWTREQAEVLVSTRHGLLSASAGTGKTTTIVGKILWMLGLDVGSRADGQPIPGCSEPCRLDEVAAITFTEKAACELKEKLREGVERSRSAEELRWELDSASVGTIHGFCSRLLRDHALRLGIDPSFRVLDEREATLRLHEIIRHVVMEALADGGDEMSLLLEKFPLYDGRHTTGLLTATESVLRDIRWHADRYAGWTRSRPSLDAPAALDADRILDLIDGDEEACSDAQPADDRGLRLAGALYGLAHRSLSVWLAWMEDENVRDYDSLILDARRLLTRPEHRSALMSIRCSLKVLIIDEFQDTDGAQQDIAFALAGIGEPEGEPGPQLLLVGDPKQSIYRFRGADLAVWNRVKDILCPDDGPMHLTVNFRAQPGVVGFVNDVCSAALNATSADLRTTAPELQIAYSPLVAARAGGATEGIDWLDCSSAGSASEVRALEARLVVSRIQRLLEVGRVTDPSSGVDRAVQARDIAILARTRAGLDLVDEGLREARIRTFNGASLGLSDRQEVIDLVTVLRLFRNPEDDYYGFAFLRSPFVGLRDEVIARFRLDRHAGGGRLLEQAARFIDRVEQGTASWFEAPEDENIGNVERTSLRRALNALEVGQALVDRVASSELLETVVRETGYRMHLLLRPGADEAIAGIERFEALLDEYRHLPLAGFLDMWDRWGDQDLGIPQAPLHSAADDVVTLQTIHSAKGLEWPIVFLIRAGDAGRDRLAGTYVADPRLGPILMPAASERGDRARTIAARELAADRAEEARLQYVALTRARDRIVVAAPAAESGYMEYMGPRLAGATHPHLVLEGRQDSAPDRPIGTRATAEDPITRTGGQIEVFDGDSKDQLDIFMHSPRAGAVESTPGRAAMPLVPVVYRAADPVQASLAPAPVSLAWLAQLEPGELPELARPVPEPARSRLSSATEMRMRARDSEAWRLRYVHGVEEAWRFAPMADGADEIPAHLRGTLIHGVLERIESIYELAGVLDETIAGIDAPPGVEEQLLPGTAYREALEAEIAGVIEGRDWQWYVADQHFRELRFLHLASASDWRLGAIDLYRPDGSATADPTRPWIIDFKTHRIGAADVATVAAEYTIQMEVYREAVAAMSGGTPRTLLHFTHPNVATEI